jgi:GxxExxY protein
MTGEALNALSKQVLDAAFAVHTELGPGLLESTYVACLKYELEARGLRVQAEVPCPVVYKGNKLAEIGYRIDLLVEGQLVIEVKAVEVIAAVHRAQLLSYLRHSGIRLGLLLNFHAVLLKDGIVRQVNRL